MSIDNVLSSLNNGVIANTFEMMGVVHKEIERAMEKYPPKADLIYEMFLSFREPAEEFSDTDTRLWESHVREILTRIGNNARPAEMRLGTNAELVLACMSESLRYPWSHDATLMYGRAFREVFGDDVWKETHDTDNDFPGQESWDGAVKELADDTKRKLSRNRNIPGE